jgi:glycosyltransferase involved in cell wall biosynthesis
VEEPGRPAVAIDVTPLIGARTGIGVAVAQTVAALRALDSGPVLAPYTLSARARFHRDGLPDDTRFVPIPARVLLGAWGRFDRPSIDRWLGGARVVHATNYIAPPSRAAVLVTVNDCSLARYPELCTPEVRALEPILRRAIARGATVHTVSEFVADEIEELFGPGLRAEGRIAVVGYGVPDLGTAAVMPPEIAARLAGAPYVLSIGTLEPRKNHAHLVSAFGELAAGDDRLHLVIAGHDGPARPAVERSIARLPEPLRSRVVLAGGVDDAGRRALLGAARVLAYPSIYEGFGFPVLEAMSVGVPVVAARAGAIPEVAGDAARLVDATDEHALASEIARLLEDDTLRTEMIARGHARVRSFSWERTALELTSWYERLANART